MLNDDERREQLSKTNPLFGRSKLKLGTFCTNVSRGATISSAEGGLDLTWPNVSRLAQLAEAMKFEAIVPLARWRGFGGSTDFNGESFEALTFSAALSAQTTHASVFATVHVPSMHPVMAAKQATTIDHISEGRFSLNIVTGWNRGEIELFGSPMLEHDERYVVADEWIALMKALWTGDAPVDFAGKYYTVRQAYLRPKPIQPYPVLMSAGASLKGRMFAAQHCDVAFTSLGLRDPVSIRERLQSYHKIAKDDFGREIKIWINAYMFLGSTEAEAQRKYEYVVHERGDHVGVDNMLREVGISQQTHSPEMLSKLKDDFIAGWAGFRLQGTKNKIVEDLKMLSDAGIDGVLLSWPAFIDDMTRFKDEVHPLLLEEGLR